MARILMSYGTTDGHTAKIARYLAQQLRAAGAEVDVVEASGAPEPRAYDGVIVAASIHTGAYQRNVRRWVAAHAAALQAKPAAFLSVCLAVLQPDAKVQRELAAITERFLARTRWRPALTKQVAGAVPYTRYGWVKRWVMRRIVAKAGGATDTTRDYEYTDWNDLSAFAQSFHRLAAGSTPRSPA
jgi:menaquinone-dependent protoporphyrinogen oxidase